MMVFRVLYYYVSVAFLAAFGIGLLLFTGLVMGFLWGPWALAPMVAIVFLVIVARALRTTVLKDSDV